MGTMGRVGIAQAGLGVKVARGGEGEGTALPAPSLRLALQRARRWGAPAERRGRGVIITLESQTCVLHVARKTRPQRKDRWSQRPMHSWGRNDCKGGEGGTWKNLRETLRNLWHTWCKPSFIMPRYHSARRVSDLSLPSATGNDDNRFGLRALFMHSAPSQHFQDGLRC